MTQVYDANKRFYYATDAFEPGKALKAGKYVAKVQVRHDDVSLLEKLKDTSAVIETTLSKAIDLAVYGSYTQAVVGGAKFTAKVFKGGKTGVVYLGVDAKAFPSYATPGSWASGTLHMGKHEGNVSVHRVGVR